MSMKTTPVTNPLSMFLSHLSVTLSSAVTVECNFLKPDCAMVIRLCLSKHCEKLVYNLSAELFFVLTYLINIP